MIQKQMLDDWKISQNKKVNFLYANFSVLKSD
jgi:hypothetical protein